MQSYLNPSKYIVLQLDKVSPEHISYYQNYGDNFSWMDRNALQFI